MSEASPPTLRSVIPEILGDLAPAVFDRPVVPEPRATCGSCAMCKPGAGAGEEVEDGFFRPDVKCCTYHPILPSYLVGGLLADTRPELDEGRRRVRAKIARRIGVSPEWIAMPRKYEVLLEAARAAFGRSDALLCPYFERTEGNCTIWPFRESVCTTFFCKHARGAAGHAFWMALKSYLNVAEKTLARWSAQSVCPEVTEPVAPRTKLDVEDLEDRPPSEEAYAKMWGPWLGREADFYVACHERVRALGRAEYARLVDASEKGREALDALARAHDAVTTPQLRKHLVLHPTLKSSGARTVAMYSRYDPLALSDDLVAVLGELRADEPVVEMVARMKREHDVDVPPDLLLELQLHQVLVAPDEPIDR